MYLKKLLTQSTQNLAQITNTPHLDVELLLAHVLKKDRSYLHSHYDQELTPIIIKAFSILLEQRLTGKPIAYILQHKEFWSLDLEINEYVLIPRPETELLVELALKSLPTNKKLHIADLGTGSGAIALALAKERPNWLITATDKSYNALIVAKKNADRLSLTNVQFVLSDWGLNLPKHKFDAIISNPPYIAEDDPHLLGSIKFEPHLALIAKNNGLEAIATIINQTKNKLMPNGLLLLEHGKTQGNLVKKILETNGYKNIIQHQDLAGLDRAISTRYNYLLNGINLK
jgi:release factor glutamine methyltransferase